MKTIFLLIVLNILIMTVIGAEYNSNRNEYILYTLDYDPMPKTMPIEWMERFYASTSSPRNFSRRRLIDLLKKKKLTEH